MREIKFRGQTANCEWVYGSLVHSKNIQPAIYFEVGKGSVKTFDFVYVKPETVGQFTGLHDSTTWEELDKQERKNWVMEGNMPSEWKGKKIYEGDLYTAFGNGLYEIRFISGSFCGGLLGECDAIFAPLGWESQDADEDLYVSIDFFKFMEVIGTIHDNPELLEVGNETIR